MPPCSGRPTCQPRFLTSVVAMLDLIPSDPHRRYILTTALPPGGRPWGSRPRQHPRAPGTQEREDEMHRETWLGFVPGQTGSRRFAPRWVADQV
jgi:hypothetical protein